PRWDRCSVIRVRARVAGSSRYPFLDLSHPPNPSPLRWIRPGGRIGTGEMTSPSPLVHLELHTPSLGRAFDFYSRLLGWRPEPVGAGGRSYLGLDLGGGLGGGAVECGTK